MEVENCEHITNIDLLWCQKNIYEVLYLRKQHSPRAFVIYGICETFISAEDVLWFMQRRSWVQRTFWFMQRRSWVPRAFCDLCRGVHERLWFMQTNIQFMISQNCSVIWLTELNVSQLFRKRNRVSLSVIISVKK